MELKVVSTFSERLRETLESQGISNVALADKIGVSKQSITMYVSGKRIPKRPTITVMAEALGVNPMWLMGFDVPIDRTEPKPTHDIDIYSFPNISPIRRKKFRHLGSIACGCPAFADEDHETYIEASADIKADFVLTAKGDSMINARIFDGDIVFIREQPDVSNGEIAAVIIDDSATLKRVYKSNNVLTLLPENPAHEPIIVTKDSCNNVKILGKAVAFQSLVK